MRCRLFLIDIGEDRTQPSVRLWGVDDKDHRVVIILNKLRPYFYFVPDSEISATQSSMSKTFPKTKVTIEDRYRLGRAVRSLKVTCPNIQVMDECVKSIRKEAKSGELFEDDLRLSVRYMTDFNATPSTWLEFNVEPMKIAGLQADQTYIATEEEPESVPISRPSLRVMGFSMLLIGTQGSPRPEHDPIRAISVATGDGEPVVKVSEKNDAQLISWFKDKVKSFDPDILVGFNSNRVHWPYLLERCKVNKLKLDLGRDLSEPHPSVYGHISIAGRATLDLLDYANGIADLKVKELNSLAAYFQIPSANMIQSIGDLVSASFWKEDAGRKRLKRNVEEGAAACLELAGPTLTYALELSALTCLPLDQVMAAAVGFRVDSYLLRLAHLREELIPHRNEQPFFSFRGAIVLEPQPGLHENIVVLDFASMYPNLMRNYNLSPDTLLRPGEDVPGDQAFVIPEVNYRFRRKPDGLYRQALSNLLTERSSIRKRLLKLDSNSSRYRELTEREKAVKVITNACYGYAGWAGARWYVREVAESATALGREAITQTVAKAKKLGLRVIYGDTDSIFVENNPEKVKQLLEWTKSALDLEIRPERVYTRVLFTEAMKRYAGILEDGSLDIVGLEAVRGDWPEISKQVQVEVLVSILRNRSLEEAVENIKSTIQKIRRGEVPVIDLAIRKSLTKPVTEYEVHAPHVEVAKKLLKDGWDLRSGDQVSYVIVRGPGKLYQKAEPYSRVSSSQVDVDYYIANQIKPVAMRVLSIFGVSEKQLGD